MAWTGLDQKVQSPMNCLYELGLLDYTDLIDAGQFENSAHYVLWGAKHHWMPAG